MRHQLRRVAPPPHHGAGEVSKRASCCGYPQELLGCTSGSESLLSALSYARSIYARIHGPVYMQVLHCVSQLAYHANTRSGPKPCTAVHNIYGPCRKLRDWLYGCTGSCWRVRVSCMLCLSCCACLAVRVCLVVLVVCVSCVCRVASRRLVLSRLVLPCRVSCMCMYVDFAALFFQRNNRTLRTFIEHRTQLIILRRSATRSNRCCSSRRPVG